MPRHFVRFAVASGVCVASVLTAAAQQPAIVVRGGAISVAQPGSANAGPVRAIQENGATAPEADAARQGEQEQPPEAVDQQRTQLLVSQPFTRNPSQLLQAWLLGPEVAFELSAPEPEPMIPTIRGMAPAPKLGVPGEPLVAAAKPSPATRIQADVEAFRRNVTLGNWAAIRESIAAMSPSDGKQVYDHLLNSFAVSVPGGGTSDVQPQRVVVLPNGMRQVVASGSVESGMAGPANYITPLDFLGMADASPTEPSETQLTQLAHVLVGPIQNGFDLQPLVAQLKSGARWLGGSVASKQVAAAKVFLQANLPELAGEFLPSFERLDRSQLALLKISAARSLALHEKQGKPAWLQQAWECFQAIAGHADASAKDRTAALEQLVRLAPKVKKEVGQAWLDASFVDQAQLGRFILSLLGTKTASGMADSAIDAPGRTEWLRLQSKALESLLTQQSPLADLQPAVTLLATNWLKESQAAVNQSPLASGQSYMQIDMYGNYYWIDPNQMNQQNNQFMPIALRDLIDMRPQDQWIGAIDASLQLAVPKMLANLYLRANDEKEAFPHIETVAARDPQAAQQLVDDFLATWTANHDPNNSQRQRNRYIYFYGFDVKADSIPLTRSQQERNLAELSDWVKRIRALPIEKIDENKLATAFTNCHSSAEVFRIEAIEKVFGAIDQLKPETVASICQTMRSNLATVWRAVRNQEEKQTKRKEPEIQQEVIRGYEVATEFAARALAAAPDDWRLHLTLACLAHDQNDYVQSVKKSSEYSDRRQAAFERFGLAARKYAAVVADLEKSKQSNDVYDYWFYAALGAVDLGRITDETVAAHAQFPLIRQALEALPGEVAQKHMADFANNLFARMSPLKPEMKFRYLSGGFEIVGNHPRAVEARKLFHYYQDLLGEIKLVAEIDGSEVVGHVQPFGVFINIYHTHEIERESGGFTKYVQNQNNMYFAYNYGRPNEDYRDKFERIVREDLAEQFEVLTVTFENPKTMHSRPARDPGWRVTPYAYLLVKPKGPQVDKLPTIKLNLDFLDTSGYIVMPIATAIIPIDAANPQQPRPYAELSVTQTLDERQAADGKLILEVKATAKGLAPELEQILDLKFPGLDVKSVDGQPVLASEFDPETEEIRMLTDRSWSVELAAVPGAEVPKQFQFSALHDPAATAVFQRYKDADLVKVERTVDLEKSYAKRDWSFLGWAIPLASAGLIGLVGILVLAARRPRAAAFSLRLPDDINPFTVLALLKHIKDRNGIPPRDIPALDQSIVDLEEFYFGHRNGHPEPDLQHIAHAWLAKAR